MPNFRWNPQAKTITDMRKRDCNLPLNFKHVLNFNIINLCRVKIAKYNKYLISKKPTRETHNVFIQYNRISYNPINYLVILVSEIVLFCIMSKLLYLACILFKLFQSRAFFMLQTCFIKFLISISYPMPYPETVSSRIRKLSA